MTSLPDILQLLEGCAKELAEPKQTSSTNLK